MRNCATRAHGKLRLRCHTAGRAPDIASAPNASRWEHCMKFGVSLGDAPHTKSLALLRAAERANFDQIWVWDSHIIWQEAYSLMGWLIGESTNDRLEWGTCVTNPVTRDPLVVGSAFATLNQITGGRVICGIGR